MEIRSLNHVDVNLKPRVLIKRPIILYLVPLPPYPNYKFGHVVLISKADKWDCLSNVLVDFAVFG